MLNAVLNPNGISTFGLASSAFARHYSRNLNWFLFLRVLRCFSSPRSLHLTMYSLSDLIFFIWVVSQFGNLRIEAYLQLPAAYRSLSRPSSAPDAKAFTLCSLLLELLSLLSFAWVSQIICLQWKSFFPYDAIRNISFSLAKCDLLNRKKYSWRGANCISSSHSLMHRAVLFCFLVRLFFRTCGQIVVFHDFQKDLQNYLFC